MRDCHTFVKVNEECLAKITNIIDKELPTKIQSFVSQVTSEYCADTHFGMPDSAILNCQKVKRDIMWDLANPPPHTKRQQDHPPN